MQRILASKVSRIVTVSRFFKNELMQALGLTDAKVPYAWSAGEHMLRVDGDNAVLVRHSLMWGEYALGVGSRNPNKNRMGLVEAMAVLQDVEIPLGIYECQSKNRPQSVAIAEFWGEVRAVHPGSWFDERSCVGNYGSWNTEGCTRCRSMDVNGERFEWREESAVNSRGVRLSRGTVREMLQHAVQAWLPATAAGQAAQAGGVAGLRQWHSVGAGVCSPMRYAERPSAWE